MRFLTSGRLGAVVSLLTTMAVSPAWSANWQALATTAPNGDKVYVDLSSIKTVEGVRIVSMMTVYPEPRVNSSGLLFDRHRQVTAIDCAEHKGLGLRTTGYLAGKMAGTSPEVATWRSKLVAIPNTPLNLEVERLACGATPGGASQSASPPWAEAAIPTPSAPKPAVSGVSTGSGVYVNADGYVLTAAHVVNGCRLIGVKGSGASAQKAVLEAIDPKNDLAVIRTQPGLGVPAVFRSASRAPALGEDVGVIGYPLAGLLSSEPKATFGEVNSVAGVNNDYTLLQISAPIQPGNSGGPVLDEKGMVVGVVVSEISPALMARVGVLPQNVNFAIRGELAQIFMQAHGVAFSSSAGGWGGRLDHRDLAARGERSTAQIVCIKANAPAGQIAAGG
jgi:S1-C subfamily serine protease